MSNEQIANLETTGNSLVSFGVSTVLVQPSDRPKVAQIIKKIENNFVTTVQAFLIGNSVEFNISFDLLMEQVSQVSPLINQEVISFFKKEAKTDAEKAAKFVEGLSVAKEVVAEFPSMLKTSKIVPYVKLICTAEQSLSKAKDGSSGVVAFGYKYILSKATEENKTAFNYMIELADDFCATVSEVDNIFDDNIVEVRAGLDTVTNFVNDPLAIINESQLV